MESNDIKIVEILDLEIEGMSLTQKVIIAAVGDIHIKFRNAFGLTQNTTPHTEITKALDLFSFEAFKTWGIKKNLLLYYFCNFTRDVIAMDEDRGCAMNAKLIDAHKQICELLEGAELVVISHEV